MSDPMTTEELIELLDQGAAASMHVNPQDIPRDIRSMAARRLEALKAEKVKLTDALTSGVDTIEESWDGLSNPDDIIEWTKHARDVLSGTQVSRLSLPSESPND